MHITQAGKQGRPSQRENLLRDELFQLVVVGAFRYPLGGGDFIAADFSVSIDFIAADFSVRFDLSLFHVIPTGETLAQAGAADIVERFGNLFKTESWGSLLSLKFCRGYWVSVRPSYCRGLLKLYHGIGASRSTSFQTGYALKLGSDVSEWERAGLSFRGMALEPLMNW